MTPTKGDVKHWLKAIGKNRDWLAMECGTEKGTVNNWLSPSGPFPASAMLKIQSLMSQYKTVQPEDEPVQTNRLVLEITEERMRKYERAASEKGVPLRQWLTDLADEAAEERQLRPTHSPLVPLVRQFPSHARHARREYSTQIIGNIAAGSLAESDTVPSTIYMEKPLGKNEYVVRVEGKSMEPLIPDGSLVIMRRHTTPPIPKPGTIVEYNDGRGVTLKKLIRRKNGIRAAAHQPRIQGHNPHGRRQYLRNIYGNPCKLPQRLSIRPCQALFPFRKKRLSAEKRAGNSCFRKSDGQQATPCSSRQTYKNGSILTGFPVACTFRAISDSSLRKTTVRSAHRPADG